MVQQTNLVLTERAERLLDAVRAGGKEWQSRKEIGERLQQSKLYDGEIELLNMFIANGLVEMQEQRQRALIVPFYRMVQS